MGVEIEVDPAPKVKTAMEEQTSAERLRGAAILRADLEKRAASSSAEGSKGAHPSRRKASVSPRSWRRRVKIGHHLAEPGEAQKLHPAVGASPRL